MRIQDQTKDINKGQQTEHETKTLEQCQNQFNSTDGEWEKLQPF